MPPRGPAGQLNAVNTGTDIVPAALAERPDLAVRIATDAGWL